MTKGRPVLRSRLLLRPGFRAFLSTQFLGAANDNILKNFLILQATSGVWREVGWGEGAGGFLQFLFTMPFLLFSSFGGQFADRFSKQRVAVVLKGVEVAVMILAFVTIWSGCYWLTVGCLLLMATQSAFFGPAKYGIIPELVEPGALSRANGWVNMTTNIAVICGLIVGGFLSEGYAGGGPWPGLVLVSVAAVGLAMARRITPTPARDPDLQVQWKLLKPIFKSLREMARNQVLIRVAFAWAFFYFLGVMVLSAVPDHGAGLFGADEARHHHTEIVLLNAALMVGIGLSSLVAGAVSGDRIRPGLVAPGIFVVAGILLAFPWLPRTYGFAMLAFLGLGLATGFYIIPLQALLQERAGKASRGRILGTTNFLSFLFMAVGGLAYFALVKGAGLTADRVLFLNGFLAVGMGGVLLYWRRRGDLD